MLSFQDDTRLFALSPKLNGPKIIAYLNNNLYANLILWR